MLFWKNNKKKEEETVKEAIALLVETIEILIRHLDLPKLSEYSIDKQMNKVRKMVQNE